MGIYQLMAFDLDDTLYPEREFVYSGFMAVARHLADLGAIDAESFFNTATGLFAAGARGNIFDLALERFAVVFPETQIKELVRVYQEHPPQIRPFAGSSRLLQLLKAKGAVLALISDGPWPTQQNKLRALGLEAWFDHLVFTGAHGEDWGKPSPRAFQEVMGQSGVPAAACVYVADNPGKDFVGPNRLGWHTIRVREPIGLYRDASPPPGGEPQATVNTFSALGDLLLA
ncbi:MAG TPA: HAD family hydrolase [Desulfobaccales bacterium]|nr:HAD family hydrolase [Desulfobaccales bacterium]